MKNLSIEEIKEIQLQILDEVNNFCEKEGIEYFLGYGTLIGAVRHKGYIPWDDDIDIVMKRDQYETFLSKFNSSSRIFKVYSCDNCDWFPYPFAKISDERTVLIEENDEMKNNIGINIDVFPLDELPIKSIKNVYIRILNNLLTLKSVKVNSSRKFYKNLILRIGKITTAFIKANTISQQINILAVNNNTNANYLGNIVFTDSSTDFAPQDAFSSKFKISFESREYYINKGYDEWLSNYYGDYMQLPPTEKRVTHHRFIAYKKI